MFKAARLLRWRDPLTAVLLILYLAMWTFMTLAWWSAPLHDATRSIAGGLQSASSLLLWLDLSTTLLRNLTRKRQAAARSAQEGGRFLATPIDYTMSVFLLLLLSIVPPSSLTDSMSHLSLQIAVFGVMTFHVIMRQRQRAYTIYRFTDEGLRIEQPGQKPLNLTWEKVLPLWGRVREAEWKAHAKEKDLKIDSPPKQSTTWLLLYRDGRRMKFVQFRGFPELVSLLEPRIGKPV